ncbi:hypothetical protein BH18ACT12_BH18ACT12_21970 [soil metagenome]
MKRLTIALACGWTVASILVLTAAADVKITDQPYVRHDGVPAADVTLASCSNDAPDPTAAGERQANEPTATVALNNSMHMTAGANDYCATPTAGDAWAGFYYSNNGGSSWVNSLLPGYPTDVSPEGQASPLYRFVGAAGDPVQAWDTKGRVFYGGIAFNRAKPNNGSIWAARYDWPQPAVAPDYEFTTIVSRGTPGNGHFEDKVQLETDRSLVSPHRDNVYMCWARFTGSGSNNFVEFARSTDGGRTWSTQKVSPGIHGNQFCDIAVTRNGTVFVAWRQFEYKPNQGQRQRDAVAWVKSTDGGLSFTKPAVATECVGWDPTDHFGSGAAAGAALFNACMGADYTIGACHAGPEPRQSARDCGDGPLVCQSGYVFHRSNTQVRITADPNGAAATADDAYVVYDGSVPTSLTPTGTTYGTVGSGTGSQASIYFIKTTNGGSSWSSPARIDAQAKGHQFFPDIDAESGKLHAFWQDSRNDCSGGPPSTPSGGDYRTVPFANKWVASNPPGGVICAAPESSGLVSVHASSSNGGTSWATEIVSSVMTMPQYEQFGARNVPFFGDYNYIDAAAGAVLMDWTDQRETVPGTDPRYTNGDGTDGFDVLQCRPTANPFGADMCPNAGGLDQNIFGFVTSG